MLRALVAGADGWQELKDDPVTTSGLRWVDLEAATEEEFQLLEKGFRFHPLAVEDCRHLDQRSKVEEYGDHLFVVLHVYSLDPADPMRLILHELHAFLRKDLLVTVHAEPNEAVRQVWQRALRGDASGCRGPGSIFHNVADAMVDQMYPVVDEMESQVDGITDRLMGRPDPANLEAILRTKRAITEMRRLTGPAREVLSLLARQPYAVITPQEALYMRNVQDHLQVIQQQIDMVREHADDARDLHLNAQSARANEIVKRLSIMATLGLPLTVITGFFGMNFQHLPFDSVQVMQGALLAMVVIPVTFLVFLWWRSWL